jgi:hypothetical protein
MCFQVLTPRQAGKAIVVAAPHYPDVLSVIDLLAEGSAAESVTSASPMANDGYHLNGRRRTPFSAQLPQHRESRAAFRDTCMPARTRSKSLPPLAVLLSGIPDFPLRTPGVQAGIGTLHKGSRTQEEEQDWEPRTPSGDEDSPHPTPEKRQRMVKPMISHDGAGNWTLIGEASVEKHHFRSAVPHAGRSSCDMPPVVPQRRSIGGIPPPRAHTSRSANPAPCSTSIHRDSALFPAWDGSTGPVLPTGKQGEPRSYLDGPTFAPGKAVRPHSFDVAMHVAVEGSGDAGMAAHYAGVAGRRTVSCDIVVSGAARGSQAELAAVHQAVTPVSSVGDAPFSHPASMSFADWEAQSKSSGSGSRRSARDGSETGSWQPGIEPHLANLLELLQFGTAPRGDFPRAVTHPARSAGEAPTWQGGVPPLVTARKTSSSPVPVASKRPESAAVNAPPSPFTFQPWLLHEAEQNDGTETPQTPSVVGYPQTCIPAAVSLPPPQRYPCGETAVRNSRSSPDIAQQAGVPTWVDFKDFIETAPIGNLDFPTRCTSLPLSASDKEVLRLILKRGPPPEAAQ